MTTEILCTLGPSSMNERVIRRLEGFGVSLLRINLSHTAVSDVAETICYIQEYSSVPICLDTEGAQVRTGDSLQNPAELVEHSFIKVCRDYVLGNTSQFNLYPRNIIDQIEVNDFITIDFNEVLGQVIEKKNEYITLRIINGGLIGRNKAVTVQPLISLPSLTEKDCQAISIGRELGVKHYALSFAGHADEVDQLRKLAGSESFIISKIESLRGLKNLKGISLATDALLIDRGDLSREVPIERIPATQKRIIAQAKKSGVKIYVATNLLESMITAPTPTRAEVNDIYNTLVDGADGLVLAAETAIGSYPIQCVDMIVRLVREFNNGESNKETDFDKLQVESQLVEPHGGKLIQSEINADERGSLETLKSIIVDYDFLRDCQMIAVGVYSPLTGFMDRETLTCVLDKNKLPEGIIWTMPIVLPVTKQIADSVSVGEHIKLSSESGHEHALLDLVDIYPYHLDSIAKKWFGTSSLDHPGVKRLAKGGEYFLSGPIKLISPLPHANTRYEMTPSQCRFVFTYKGWHHVVGFHTRNVPHRAHEYVQLQSLKKTNADGLFINPLLGGNNPGNFLSTPIIKSYQLLLESGVYPKGQVVLGSFSTYSRNCGPRETVFTALCQKNMGCDYFIVGPNHNGLVFDDHKPNEDRRFFESLGELGITPVYLDAIGFDDNSGKYLPKASNPNQIKTINATLYRKAILKGEIVPDWFVRNTVQELVFSELNMGREIFHGQ